jgi:hypothetical protein
LFIRLVKYWVWPYSAVPLRQFNHTVFVVLSGGN